MNNVPAPEPKLALAVAAAHTAGQGKSPLPRPSTADPSETTATVRPFQVRSDAALGSSAMASQGRATPGV